MKQTSKPHDISGCEVQDEIFSSDSVRPDPEVSEKKPGGKFTAAYKLRILREFDACTHKGEKGALLRREGLYHPTYAHGNGNVKRGSYGVFPRKNVAGKPRKSIRWQKKLPSWNERTGSWQKGSL